MKKKKVCVVTGTRAEYGLFFPLLCEFRKQKTIHLQLLVTGAHLSPEFDLTYRQIVKDGFKIDEKVEILLSSDTAVGVTKSMGLALIGFGEALDRLKPDIVVVLGDRFETLCAATAAHTARVAVAHLHGGESSEGAMDEAFRHAVTKMSQLHFTSTEKYRRRVIQLGEQPSHVFNVGAIGIDNIRNLKLLSRRDLGKALDFSFGPRNLLVTFHPATLENHTSERQFAILLNVLKSLPDTRTIFTRANADAGGRGINAMMERFVEQHPAICRAYGSLGQLRYLSALQYMDAVVGNSSSGIIEAPTFKIGSINIGSRQAGRIRAKSVIDCEATEKDIRAAFKKLYSKNFQETLKGVKNPYGSGNTARKIAAAIVQWNPEGALMKVFYEIRN